MWQRVGWMGGRTERKTDASPCTAVVFFFPHICCQVTVTMLLLFGHLTLLCGKFLFIKLSEEPVQISGCTIDRPWSRPVGLVKYRPDQCQSKISPLAASETFAQRRMWRIVAGYLHANNSVNWAIVFYPKCHIFKLCFIKISYSSSIIVYVVFICFFIEISQ